MTALWRSLTDSYPDFAIFISLEDENVPVAQSVKRWDRKGVTQPVWADDPKQVWERKLIPARLLCPGEAGEATMAEWCESADVARSDERKVGNLRQRIASYPVPFLSLPVTTSQETALEVFINMNTSASPLRDFDIVVAQMEAAGESLHERIQELQREVPSAADFSKVGDLALSVGALLMDKPPLKKTYLETTFGKDLSRVWPQIVRGIKRGVAFLRDEAIYGEKLLPTEVIVYLVSALWAKTAEHGHDIEGQARTLIRKTLWRACFTDRYLKTAATRAFSDYIRISALLQNKPIEEQPELFNEEFNPLPRIEEISKAGWPARKDRLGRAILAVSLHKRGYDFADGSPASERNIGDREYHHLYPVGSLGLERDNPHVSRAINCALITWKTNRKISARTPKEYIGDRTDQATLGEDEVRRRLESHMVPYDALVAGDYDAFIAKRSALVHEAMLKLCVGGTIAG